MPAQLAAPTSDRYTTNKRSSHIQASSQKQCERSRQCVTPKFHQFYRMFSTENYLHEPQDIEFETTTISFVKEFKEFKEDS
jgi:phosphorylcholine metabolism protein LicD